MSTCKLAERKPNVPAHAALSDVYRLVIASPELSAHRQRDIASALRTVSKALRCPLEELPAHPALLRSRLKGFTPAMAGLSAARWRNVMSLTRAALPLAGLAKMPARALTPISADWAATLELIADARARSGLSRLARYCTALRISPTEVTEDVLDRLLDDLENDCLVTSPAEILCTTRRVWNSAAASIAGWPGQPLARPGQPRFYGVGWEQFPSSLRHDVEAYLKRLAGEDPLAELDFRPLRPRSVQTRHRQLHNFISALVRRGRDPQGLRTLADVVAVDTVKDGLRFFLGRSQSRMGKHAYDIACLLLAVARHWVQADAGHLDALRAILTCPGSSDRS